METKYTVSKSKKILPTKNKFILFLFSFILCLFVIFASVKITLNFRTLYYFDIDYLHIEETSHFSRSEIIENYNYVIDYMGSPINNKFVLPSIPYSQPSQIHFYDVKKIFHLIDILLIITGLIGIIGIYFNIKKKSYTFLKWSSSMLLSLPILLTFAFATNPDSAFTTFHKIFFNNNYWILSSKTDPIIDIMPQEFFYHAAILIGFLIVLFFILFRLVYRLVCKNKISHS